MVLVLASLTLLTCSPVAFADWRSSVGAARLTGQGEFTLLGFRVYDAQLWSIRSPIDYRSRFALRLTYARSISRERLADTGLDEIKRLATTPIAAATLERWHSDMLHAFIDVTPGDRLTGVFLPGQGVRFYAGGRPGVEIDDPEFARAFFDIWLDLATRAPELRRHLLGLAQ
jgi:hypothetical protein